MKPLILLNFKNYPEAQGLNALKLAKKISQIKNKKFLLAVAPNELDLEEVVKAKIPVFAQHVDPILAGAYTGKISLQELKQLGVKGTILNHSERKLSLPILSATIKLCRQQKFITVACASTLNETKKIAKLKPDYLAYEPAALIGGNISVTSAKPKILLDVIKAVKKISPKTKVLCGAGIHNHNDLKQALKLGADGILLAHALVEAKDPKRFLEKLLD